MITIPKSVESTSEMIFETLRAIGTINASHYEHTTALFMPFTSYVVVAVEWLSLFRPQAESRVRAPRTTTFKTDFINPFR